MSPNSFPVLRLMKCSFVQAGRTTPRNSFSGASSSSNRCWTFSLVVGQVKRKAPMASLPCSSIGRNGGRGPVCLGGRASQPERPRSAGRSVRTLWSCDRPGFDLAQKWAAETHAIVRRPLSATPNAPARAAGVVAIESIVFRKYDRAIHTTARVNTDAQLDG